MESNNDQRILVFIDWFRPAYKAGGPIQSVVNLVNKLQEFDFWICTSDKDIGSTSSLDNIALNQWSNYSNNCQVIYISAEKRNKSFFSKIFNEVNPSVIYFNSMFSMHFTLMPYLTLKKKNTKLILAPRGMLGSGPLSSKAFKKKLFIQSSKITGLFKKVYWHVSSQIEANDVKNSFGNSAKTIIAPNLSISNKIGLKHSEKKVGTLNLFTISRIARIKNIHRTLAFLKSKLNGEVHFHIYGPLEDDSYWKECLHAISALPKNIRVIYHGELHPNEVQQTINAFHFLMMPTEHENYGHSIVESFLACKPVIISDQTPWKNLEKKNVGWEIPLGNPEKFVQVIQRALDMNQEDYSRMSENALNYGNTISNDKSVLEANRVLFSK